LWLEQWIQNLHQSAFKELCRIRWHGNHIFLTDANGNDITVEPQVLGKLAGVGQHPGQK
jgi:hypothetical protein